VYQLSDLGFGPYFESQLPSTGDSPPFCARIAAEHRGAYEVWSQAGTGAARLAGRLRLDLGDAAMPGVGDWVVLRNEPGPHDVAVIERLLARRTVFTRGAAGGPTRSQVVAANVDRVFVVCGLDGDFNVRRIERYVARVWASGAEPTVVLSKADLCEDLGARIAEVERHCALVPVFATSARRAEGLAALQGCVAPGRTVALVGSSGAGKSTLVNALLGSDQMRTGEVRASDSRGRHVTTHRQLILLPGGGLLLDTPGMRELQLVDEGGLDSVFGDIAALAVHCQYGDCRHESEPGCAVKAAVESGDLDPARLDHHRKLEREARAFELRQDVHKRRQADRVWGQLHREVAQLRRWRGGK